MLIHLNLSLPLALGLQGEDIEKLAKELTFKINQYRLIERKCLFYDNRICHVREQMNISDTDLKEDKVLTERERAIRVIQEDPLGYDTYRMSRNVADWLVNGFCRICPHLKKKGE